MSKKRPVDVFIIHSPADDALADAIARRLAEHDLAVYTPKFFEGKSDRALADLVRDSIAETRAVVAVVTDKSVHNPNVMYELGAAFAWNKATFLVTGDPTPTVLPSSLASVERFNSDRLDLLADRIKESAGDLSVEEEETLGEVYRYFATPVDTLFRKQWLLRRMTENFNERTGKAMSREAVLESLVRIRKQGRLPSLGIRKKTQKKAR